MDTLSYATGASVPLEAVLCTEELQRRPARPPDYQAENQALLALAQELTNSPGGVLQRLVDIALELCRGHSAGISLLEEGPPGHLSPRGDHFRWHAVAGQWAPLIWNTTTRRDYGPCGTVLDRNCTLLFANAHLYYAQFAGVEPLLIEGLLVPFHVAGQAVGTVWVVAHDDSRKFDAEDRRLLESLATFAATAYQARVSLSAQAKANQDLHAEIAERQRAEEALRQSEQELADFFDHAALGLHWVSPDGIILRANQAELSLLGYTREEYIGHHIAEFHADQEVIADILQRLQAGEALHDYEARLVCKDGTIKQVLIDANVLWRQGQFIHTRCCTRDITAQKQIDETRERLAAIVDSSDDAIISKTLEGIITSWNRGAERLYGYTAGEVLGQPLSLLIPPDLPDDLPRLLERLQRGETIDHYETQRLHKDGTRRDVSLTISPIRDSAGRIIGASKIARDITARKRTEMAQHLLAQASTLLASSLDPATQLKQLAHVIVPTLADWCCIDLLQDDGRIHRLAVVHADPTKAAFAARLHQQYAMLTVDAPHTLAQVLRTGQPWFDPAVSANRLRAEARDAAHWTLMQALGFQSEIVVPLLARGRVLGTITCVLGEGVRHYSPEDLAVAEELARRAALVFDNARLYQEARTSQAALQQAHTVLEQRVADRTALLALMHDITVAANAAPSPAAALQVAVDRLCAYTGWPVGHAYLQAPDGAGHWVPTPIWHLADPVRFVAFQQATQTLQIAPGEDLIGRVGATGTLAWGVEVATDPTFQRRHVAGQNGLTTGFASPLVVGQEVVGVLEFYAAEPLPPDPALLDTLRQIGIALGRTIERQRAQEQMQRQQEALFQREKLAAMGSLLASVAHELNNPLAVILMQADLLRADAHSGLLAEYAADLTEAATRCERLVRQFLTLARQHVPERTAVDLHTLMTDTLEMLAPVLRVENIAVAWCLAADLPRLWADPHQLQQVLVNLVTNAQQALHDVAAPRQLTLTTRWDPVRSRVALEVADSGPGIPPEIQARLFEPFFTTKPPGVGTGLGLPLCQGIIESHGGTMGVRSAPGQGTTFWVELPVGVIPAHPPTPASQDEARATVPGLAILLVDDEPSIAKALPRLLQRDGHTVDTAANGRLALAMLQERSYDLILSDLRMPELDGPGLYRALEQYAPLLCRRFIFLTGDTLSLETVGFFEQHSVPRLIKPFTAAEVRRAIVQAWRAG
jgi:PAS domain S-box-containing protein